MITDILDLAEFEREFAAGKFDHLVANIKKTRSVEVLKAKHAADKARKNAEKQRMLEQKAELTKPIEVPVPAAIIKNFLIITCLCCEKETISLQKTQIRMDYKETKSAAKRSHFVDFDTVPKSEIGKDLTEVPVHTVLLLEKCNNCLTKIEDKVNEQP